MSVKTYNAECDYPITTPSGRVIEPPTGRCWRLSKNAFFERLHDNRIYFGADGNSVPCIKRFLTELKFDGMAPQSIMYYKDVGHSQEGAKEVTSLLEAGAFNGPKPVRLLSRLLTLANTDKDGNDIILDFFSGSATTAHAVMQLNKEDDGNRKFIMVQLPEVCDENCEAYKAGYKNICEIGKERIRRAGKKLTETDGQIKLGEEKNDIDIGFKVFKLDTSNLKTWDATPIVEDDLLTLYDRMNGMINRVKTDRTDMDMVCEIMLKMGVPLTYSITKVVVNGKAAYTVGDDCLLLICLAENVQPADVEAMAEYAPAKIIIARDSFRDDTAMANAHYILRDKGIELKLV
jgi:adenine-specific DNA-methyltransferase